MIYCYKYYQKVSKYPTGPRPLPFVGNCHQIDYINIQDWLGEQAKIHGPVFTIFTPTPTVILMNYDTVREAFQDKQSETSGRPLRTPEILLSKSPNTGISTSNGENWLEQRTGSLHFLRQISLKANKIERSITIGVKEYLKYIEQSKSIKSYCDIILPTKLFVTNNLQDILFNYRYYYPSSTYKNFINNLELASQKIDSYKCYIIAQLIPFYPYFYHLLFIFTGQLVFKVNQMFRFVRDEVSKSKILFNEKNGCKSFSDEYVKRIEILKLQDTTYTLENLETTALNLFTSGFNVSNEVIKGCLLCLAENQYIQKEMRKEIEKICDKENLVSIVQRMSLPYCNSVIFELLRYTSITSFTHPHITSKEITINSLTIPSGTVLIGNLYNIHHNDKSFIHGDIIIPDRFISPDTGKLSKELLVKLIPFGLGPRKCIGEEIMIMELFLLLTNIVKYYNIKKYDDNNIDTIHYHFNSTAKVQTSKYVFEEVV
uniref:Cytochrome P450 n=1 Tax=Parastrongyloides trichosuri TaxID=131310 RepID=A0A0N4Z7N3_PARTI